MLKKLLALSMVFVMLFLVTVTMQTAVPIVKNASAAATADALTASSFEAIGVKRTETGTDSGSVQLFNLNSGWDLFKLQNYNYTSDDSTQYSNWIYMKCDISAFNDIENIKSVALSIGMNFNKTATVYVKALEKDEWDRAVNALGSESSVTVAAETAATDYTFPIEDSDADTLGTVYRKYGNQYDSYKLTGYEYTKTNDRTCTVGGGNLLSYVKNSAKDKSLYLSVSLKPTSSDVNARYANYLLGTSRNFITASNDVMVVYNSVAGTKFNTTVDELARATDFYYSTVVAPENTKVRMLAAIYGENNRLLDIISSGILTAGEDSLNLKVPLSEHTNATSVKCFLWDAETLRPYAEPKETPVVFENTELILAECDEAGTTAYEYGAEVSLITPTRTAKGGKYTFKNWSDGTNTYAAGDKITITGSHTLTAQWDYESYGVMTVEFDKKSLVKAGAYSSTGAAYDDTIKEVTENITGVQNVNVRKPASGYWRRYVYATIDLKNEKKAEQVLLNILASRLGDAKGNYIYVDTMEKVPEVGETNPDSTGRAAFLQLIKTVNGTMQQLDITEAYNNALGKELCLRVYGWAYTDSKAYSYVKLNADTLKLDVTPYVEGKYTVTFDKGAEPIYADIDAEITLPEYSIKIPGQKFTGWSDGTTTYQAGAAYKVTNTTRFTAVVEDDPDSMTEAQKLLDGKKIIFIGNSFIYYGRTVKNVSSDYPQQSKRVNDTGGFYQLCKKNYIDVDVTNWTFGGHKLGDLFGAVCTYSGCSCYENNEKHEDYLTDKYYDYVVVSPGSGESQSNAFLENVKYITEFFQAENPNVKVIILGNAAGHGVGTTLTTIASTYKTLYNEGYPIADWGYLVKNIIAGTETVSGATQEYNKNTFIVNADGYHPNLLSGYITTLFTYCTITGEKAEGQHYEYLLDSTTAPADIDAFVDKYYKNGDADTTFPEILKSEADIRGIQKLIDKYIEEKAYLTEY